MGNKASKSKKVRSDDSIHNKSSGGGRSSGGDSNNKSSSQQSSTNKSSSLHLSSQPITDTGSDLRSGPNDTESTTMSAYQNDISMSNMSTLSRISTMSNSQISLPNYYRSNYIQNNYALNNKDMEPLKENHWASSNH